MVAAPSTTLSLEALLKRLSPLGSGRFITMRPDVSCILEATVDLSLPETTTNVKTMPSGKTLLTLASSDKSFECHLDVGKAASATIAISAKTGGPIVRISDADENVLCTICLPKDKAAEFGAIRASLGEVVRLSGGAGAAPSSGDGEDDDEAEFDAWAAAETACRLVTGEELEVELQDGGSPIILDCFARWCGPCQLMAPVMDDVAARLNGPGGSLARGANAAAQPATAAPCRVFKMDTDEYPDMAELLRVEGLPTILFVGAASDGSGRPQVLHRFEGAAPADHIVGLAEHYLYGIGAAPVNPLAEDGDAC